MSSTRQYPETATVEDFLTLAREEGITRYGQAGEMAMFDWIVFDGDMMLNTHCMLHETDEERRTAVFSTYTDIREIYKIVESALNRWRIFPVFRRLDPMVMIARDPGIVQHHEVQADDPAFLFGVSGGFDYVLGQARSQRRIHGNRR